MAEPLAVVAVWAGLLGYVIPAAFSTASAVTATPTSAASPARVTPHRVPGSPELGRASQHPRAGLQARSAPGSMPDPPARQPDTARVRVIQASPRPRRVTVTLGRWALSRDQAFASVTPYRSVRPGSWTVRAVGAGERTTKRVTLAPGTATTLVVLDGQGRLAVGAPEVSADVRQATASAPPSPGHSAPEPVRSPIPWLVLGGTGLLLSLAWIARLRQLRWARRVAAHIR